MASSSSRRSSRRSADDRQRVAGQAADTWTKEENKRFETALAAYDEGTAERWQKVTRYVRTKTEEEVKRHYQLLVDDIEYIENAQEPLVNYPSSSSSSHGRWRVVANKDHRSRVLNLHRSIME